MAELYFGYTETVGNAELDALWTLAHSAQGDAAAASAAVVTLTTTVTDNAATAAAATAAVVATVAALPTSAKWSLVGASGPHTAAAGELTGAVLVAAQYTGISGSTLTTRTATQMVADAGLVTGQTYIVRILNTAGGTLTLTAGGGVAVAGHVAILTDTWVDFFVAVGSPTAMTFQSIGSGVAP